MSYINTAKEERGIGLVIVLLLMAMVAALGSGIIATNVSDLTISNNWGNRSVAFYAADSGVDVLVRDLRSDPSWLAALIDTTTWEPVDPIPLPLTVNGAAITTLLAGGPVAPGYFRFGADAPLGNGTYARQIELPPLVNVVDGDGTITFRVRSEGRGGARGGNGGGDASRVDARGGRAEHGGHGRATVEPSRLRDRRAQYELIERFRVNAALVKRATGSNRGELQAGELAEHALPATERRRPGPS